MHGAAVNSRCNILLSVPVKLGVDSFQLLLSIIDKLWVCPGHPDAHFIDMIEARKGKLLSKDKSVAAFLVDTAPVMIGDEVYEKTICCSNCELMIIVFGTEIHYEKFITDGKVRKSFPLLGRSLLLVV